MNNICNIFNPINKDTGNFLLFSQYVEDLSRSTNDSTFKVRPSKFVCMNIDSTVQDNANSSTQIGGVSPFTPAASETPYMYYIPGYFQDIFEDGITALKNSGVSVDQTYFSLNFMNCLRQLSTADVDKLPTYIKYVGNVDSTSWEDGFADVILSIVSGSTAKKISYNQSIPTHSSNSQLNNEEDSGTYYIQGWKGATNLPISPETNGTITVPTGWDTSSISSSTSAFDAFINVQEYDPQGQDPIPSSFTFNTILILYDILDSSNNPIYSGIPMGIYFTGIGDSTGALNPVTIYRSVESAYGAGSGWSLRICTRFSSIPYGNLKVEEISLEPGVVPESISRILGAAAETIQTVRTFADESIYNSQGFRDLTNLVKDGKMNVPYVREVNGVKYWFVNGRNTEVPVYQN